MTHHGPHPNAELLTLWALGDCDAFESDAIGAHVDECTRCRKEAAATRATVDLLLADADRPAGAARLATARQAARAALGGPAWPRRWPIWAGAAVAAGLLGLAAIGLPGGVEPAGDPGPRHPVGPTPVTTVARAPEGPSGPEHPEVRPDPPVAPGVQPEPAADPTGATPAPAEPAGPPSPGGDNPFVTPPEHPTVVPPPPVDPSPSDPRAADPPAVPAPSGPNDAASSKPATPETPAAPAAPGPSPGASPDASPGATPGAMVDRPTSPAPTDPATPAGPTTQTRPAVPAAMSLSALVNVGSALAHWPGGDETLDRGAGVPWGVEVTLTPKSGRPVVLVMRDGGILTVDAGAVTVRLDPPPGDGPEAGTAPGDPGPWVEKGAWWARKDGERGERVQVQPRGAAKVYLAAPFGTLAARSVRLGALEFVMHSGTEMLATFAEDGEAIAIAELSGDLGLHVTEHGVARECPPDHFLDLRGEAPVARRGAAAAAVASRFNLGTIRRLHAAEALRVVLDAAKAGPVAARLSESFSHLRPETLRRSATVLVRLLKTLEADDAPAGDAILIARMIQKADRAGLDVRFLVEKARWARLNGKSGAELEDELDEFLDLLKNKSGRKGDARFGKFGKKG